MQKELLLSELKLLELKLQALKAKVCVEAPAISPHTSADLYGLLSGCEEITPEDVEAIQIRLKEPPG
jgi:hypothetical protein